MALITACSVGPDHRQPRAIRLGREYTRGVMCITVGIHYQPDARSRNLEIQEELFSMACEVPTCGPCGAGTLTVARSPVENSPPVLIGTFETMSQLLYTIDPTGCTI
jgi:hypothetical protein